MCLQLETLPSPEVHWTAHNRKRIATFYGAQAPTRKRHTKLAWFVDNLAWLGLVWLHLVRLGSTWLGLTWLENEGEMWQTEAISFICSTQHWANWNVSPKVQPRAGTQAEKVLQICYTKRVLSEAFCLGLSISRNHSIWVEIMQEKQQVEVIIKIQDKKEIWTSIWRRFNTLCGL